MILIGILKSIYKLLIELIVLDKLNLLLYIDLFVKEQLKRKLFKRAAKKLKIDHLIIQKGKNIQNKVSALEMTNILQYGADKLFSEKNTNDNVRKSRTTSSTT